MRHGGHSHRGPEAPEAAAAESGQAPERENRFHSLPATYPLLREPLHATLRLSPRRSRPVVPPHTPTVDASSSPEARHCGLTALADPESRGGSAVGGSDSTEGRRSGRETPVGYGILVEPPVCHQFREPRIVVSASLITLTVRSRSACSVISSSCQLTPCDTVPLGPSKV